MANWWNRRTGRFHGNSNIVKVSLHRANKPTRAPAEREKREKRKEGGVTSRRKVRPGNISRRGRTKRDTMPRAGSILLGREDHGREDEAERELRSAERSGPTLLLKRCSHRTTFGKQRATGREPKKRN